MLRMKSPMVLRARLIHQVRLLGGLHPSLLLPLSTYSVPGTISVGDWKLFHAFCGSGWPMWYFLALADGFLLAIAGPEDGGVKASPVPSDPEKPGTPGEGMLSSDLDRIPTEGEAVTHTLRI